MRQPARAAVELVPMPKTTTESDFVGCRQHGAVEHVACLRQRGHRLLGSPHRGVPDPGRVEIPRLGSPRALARSRAHPPSPPWRSVDRARHQRRLSLRRPGGRAPRRPPGSSCEGEGCRGSPRRRTTTAAPCRWGRPTPRATAGQASWSFLTFVPFESFVLHVDERRRPARHPLMLSSRCHRSR